MRFVFELGTLAGWVAFTARLVVHVRAHRRDQGLAPGGSTAALRGLGRASWSSRAAARTARSGASGGSGAGVARGRRRARAGTTPGRGGPDTAAVPSNLLQIIEHPSQAA